MVHPAATQLDYIAFSQCFLHLYQVHKRVVNEFQESLEHHLVHYYSRINQARDSCILFTCALFCFTSCINAWSILTRPTVHHFK